MLGRIIITYKSPLGFYTDLITTKHRHLDDLEIDLKRMVLSLTDVEKARMADYEIFSVGYFNDDTGNVILHKQPMFILQFPKVGIDNAIQSDIQE